MMSLISAMRLTSLVVLFASLALNIFEVEAFEEGSVLAELYKKWKIGMPTVSLNADNNTFTIDYDVHDDFITPANVRTEMMTQDCLGPQIVDGVTADYVSANNDHVFQLYIQTFTQNETFTTISEDGLNATMKLCLKYSLWSDEEDEEDAIEINNLYNILTVYMGLEDGYAVDIAVNVELWVWNDDEVSEDDDEVERKEKLENMPPMGVQARFVLEPKKLWILFVHCIV